MLAGELYRPGDPALQAEHFAAKRWMARYNAASAAPAAERWALLAGQFAAIGPGCVVRPPFHCDYGGNIAFGADVFLNFGCIILDVAAVEIGDRAQLGPGVHIYAADHPRDPGIRRQGLESGRPVRIGTDAWIGGGAIILPGVSIGAGATVGAGSIVTHDVPAGGRVTGNPARPMPERT